MLMDRTDKKVESLETNHTKTSQPHLDRFEVKVLLLKQPQFRLALVKWAGKLELISDTPSETLISNLEPRSP